MAFEDVTPSAHRMKATFLCTLCLGENLYIVNSTNSLVDFLTWLGYR